MPSAGVKAIAAERLELSRSPTAELAAAAVDAKAEAELDGSSADLIVVAVPRGTVTDALVAIRSALE